MASDIAEYRHIGRADISEESQIKFGVYLLTLDDVRYVFKPADNPYKEFGDYKNEVAAYRLSRYLFQSQGSLSIPLTVLATYNGQVGSLQRYVEGHRPPDDLAGLSHCQLRLGALFDWITNNTDRNLAGLLMAPKHLYLIDHGSTFTRESPCRSVLVSSATGLASSADWGPFPRAAIGLAWLQSHMDTIYGELGQLIAEPYIDAMYSRIAAIRTGD